MGNDITLIARCEHDAVMYGPNGELQYANIKALNEWDSRVSRVVTSLLQSLCVSAVYLKMFLAQ